MLMLVQRKGVPFHFQSSNKRWWEKRKIIFSGHQKKRMKKKSDFSLPDDQIRKKYDIQRMNGIVDLILEGGEKRRKVLMLAR